MNICFPLVLLVLFSSGLIAEDKNTAVEQKQKKSLKSIGEILAEEFKEPDPAGLSEEDFEKKYLEWQAKVGQYESNYHQRAAELLLERSSTPDPKCPFIAKWGSENNYWQFNPDGTYLRVYGREKTTGVWRQVIREGYRPLLCFANKFIKLEDGKPVKVSGMGYLEEGKFYHYQGDVSIDYAKVSK